MPTGANDVPDAKVWGWSSLGDDWKVCILANAGLAVLYTLRINVSVAIVDMADQYDYTSSQSGLILACFYIGYMLGQVPFSLLCMCNKNWVREIFATSLFLPSFLTLITPFFAQEFWMVCLLRVLTGLTESATFPATYEIFYFVGTSPSRRTKMVSFIMSGVYIGTIIGFLGAGLLVGSTLPITDDTDVGGWPSCFYMFGLVGMIFCPFFIYLCPDLEETHQYSISLSRLSISLSRSALDEGTIHEGLLTDSSSPHSEGAADHSQKHHDKSDLRNGTVEGRTIGEVMKEVPWRAFFTNRVSLTLLFNGYNFGFLTYLMLSELPTFLYDVVGTSLRNAGLYSVFVFSCMFLAANGIGRVLVRCEQERGWSTELVRHVAQTLATGVSCLWLIGASFANKNEGLSVFLIALSQMSLAAVQSGLNCSYIEVAAQYSCILNAVSNFFTSLGGVIAPLFAAILLDSDMSEAWAWRAVFMAATAQSLIALAVYINYFTPKLVPVLCRPSPNWNGSSVHAGQGSKPVLTSP